MAEILSSFVKPAMEELGRVTLVKIKHLFTYLCFFNNNIQSLRDEAQKLEDARDGLQMDVVAAENDAHQILPEVRTWLGKASNKIEVDKKGIEDEIPTVKNGCWGVKSRFRLSRKAVKLTTELKQLIEERSKFNHISKPPLPAAQADILVGTTYDFQSRKKIEEEIMEALRAKEVTTMGMCGMGGVGKTTMAKRIMDKAKKENIFQEIFMVVVSQQVDDLKIQGAIAESLGLKLGEETLLARATKLRARLAGTKRILIVIDDVWEKLKLEDLGIPCGNERCMILLTSRNKDVLKEMDAKVYGVEILSDTEAWSLFREKTGSCVDDQNLLSTAEKVAKECRGLPIALITVGGALKDQTNITFWEDALQQLKSFNPEDMPSVIKDVYNPLKLSYSKLESRRAKKLFLLCSLFPEDANISLEELTSYCIGLQIYSNSDFSSTSEGILEKVNNRVFKIVDMLKNRFLLLNGRDEHHVKMHDVVRDVAIYIAKHGAKEEIVGVKFNSRHLSSGCTYHWGSVISEETSSFLMMQGLNWRERFEINDFSIFEGIKQLSLLSFQFIIMKSMPLEIQLLKNLRTLRLVDCKLESFSMVGKLFSLEILVCDNCDGIEELPVEIGNLNQLKQLNFTRCQSLKRIPPGIISNLVELEEFKMLYSFKGWELAGAAKVEGEGSRNACLNEFANLSKLTCLQIMIKDFNLAAEEINFSQNIVRYLIYIGIGGIYYPRGFDTLPVKGMRMELPGDISLGSWVVEFLKSANELELKGDGLNPLDLQQSHSMKSLIFEDCSTVKKMVNSTTTSIEDLSKFDVFPILERLRLSNLPNLEEILDGQCLECSTVKKVVNSTTTSIDDLSKFDVFPILKDLYLCELPNLKEIYDGTVSDQSNFFKNLQWLSLIDLPALKHLCKVSNRSTVSLDKLRDITISACNKLHSLFSFTNSNGTDQISTAPTNVDELLCTQTVFFPTLERMHLYGLDKLEVIWNSPIQNQRFYSFKNLRELNLINLPSMTHLWKSPNLRVSLDSLSDLYIQECHKLRNLFSSTIMSIDVVLQLTKLGIGNCEMMEQVVFNDNDENQYGTIHFTKLLELRLHSLQSLTAFGKGVESVEFPILEEMSIVDCPKLMSLLSSDLSNQNSGDDHDECASHLFCSQKISFGRLKRVSINIVGKHNIWCPQIPDGFFKQLEKLEIRKCTDIKSLFSSSIAKNLVTLKILEINECKEMVKVIEDDEEMSLYEKSRILFPSLEKLELKKLPKLECFCNWTCDLLRLPSLKKVNIWDCPLVQFITMKSVIYEKIIIDRAEKEAKNLNSAIQLCFEANHRCQSITPHEISFGSLKEVKILSCGGITRLFSSLTAENLINLEYLKIHECKEIITVIEDDEQISLCEKSRILFPNLKWLALMNLSKLECFCNWTCDLQLPSLEYVQILDCPLLQFFTMKSVTTPKLEKIMIDLTEKEVRDLNGAIQIHFGANQRPQLISPQECKHDQKSTSTEVLKVEEKSQIEEEEIE